MHCHFCLWVLTQLFSKQNIGGGWGGKFSLCQPFFAQKWFLLRWFWKDWWMFLAELSPYMLRFILIGHPRSDYETSISLILKMHFQISIQRHIVICLQPILNNHLLVSQAAHVTTSELLWSQIIGNVQTQCCGRCGCCNGWVVVGGSLCFALSFFTRWLRSPRIW